MLSLLAVYAPPLRFDTSLSTGDISPSFDSSRKGNSRQRLIIWEVEGKIELIYMEIDVANPGAYSVVGSALGVHVTCSSKSLRHGEWYNSSN